jgi:hypothetical protein
MTDHLLLAGLFLLALVLLDLAALRWGVDSRPRIGDRPDW